MCASTAARSDRAWSKPRHFSTTPTRSGQRTIAREFSRRQYSDGHYESAGLSPSRSARSVCKGGVVFVCWTSMQRGEQMSRAEHQSRPISPCLFRVERNLRIPAHRLLFCSLPSQRESCRFVIYVSFLSLVVMISRKLFQEVTDARPSRPRSNFSLVEWRGNNLIDSWFLSYIRGRTLPQVTQQPLR